MFYTLVPGVDGDTDISCTDAAGAEWTTDCS